MIIYDDCSTTAYFTFSTQISPEVHQFRIYGPKNSIIVDDLRQTVTIAADNYKSYLNHFIPPLLDAKQQATNSLKNVKRFLKREAYLEGRRYLIEKFYKSVTNGDAVPIPYKEIVLTSRIMDNIFRAAELNNKQYSLQVKIEMPIGNKRICILGSRWGS